LPFYTGNEPSFINSFMVGLCRPEQKINNLKLLVVAEHYCIMLPHPLTRSLRDNYKTEMLQPRVFHSPIQS